MCCNNTRKKIKIKARLTYEGHISHERGKAIHLHSDFASSGLLDELHVLPSGIMTVVDMRLFLNTSVVTRNAND